jgi:hypothetical protein
VLASGNLYETSAAQAKDEFVARIVVALDAVIASGDQVAGTDDRVEHGAARVARRVVERDAEAGVWARAGHDGILPTTQELSRAACWAPGTAR